MVLFFSNVDFYKTTLVVENGTVTPNKILTMEGNKFNLPEPSANTGYEMQGLYTLPPIFISLITLKYINPPTEAEHALHSSQS